MLLSTWRVRATLLVFLALLVGAGVIMTEAQEADEATRPPKSVRGTLDNVNTRVNTVVIKSDDGQTLSWRFDRPVIEEIRTFEAGTPVIVIYRQLPQGIN